VQEIAHWLEKLGMSEYAQRFAENDIDASVLSHLTDQSLKELGISLGHSRPISPSGPRRRRPGHRTSRHRRCQTVRLGITRDRRALALLRVLVGPDVRRRRGAHVSDRPSRAT
jgi:hypothetical protein